MTATRFGLIVGALALLAGAPRAHALDAAKLAGHWVGDNGEEYHLTVRGREVRFLAWVEANVGGTRLYLGRAGGGAGEGSIPLARRPESPAEMNPTLPLRMRKALLEAGAEFRGSLTVKGDKLVFERSTVEVDWSPSDPSRIEELRYVPHSTVELRRLRQGERLTRIEIRDKTTGEILLARGAQDAIPRVLQDQPFVIRVIGREVASPPSRIEISIRSSEGELVQELPRQEHAGGAVPIWEHREDEVTAKATTRIASKTQLRVPRLKEDTLIISALGRTVKVRVMPDGNWLTADILAERLRDLGDLYQVLLRNPGLPSEARRELLAKAGLAGRAVAFYDRGDVSPYWLVDVLKGYFDLLQKPVAELGPFDTRRRVDPALLPKEMRERPVAVPYALEEERFLAAKRAAGGRLENHWKAKTIEAVAAGIGIPLQILETPKQIAEQLNVLFTGRQLDGQWATSDDKLLAGIDLGLLAVLPLVSGVQGLRATRAARINLVDSEGFAVVQRAQEALGAGNLSLAQARRIVKAHHTGRPRLLASGEHGYEWRDLRRKMEILTDPAPGSLTRAQADLLVRLGIVGKKRATPRGGRPGRILVPVKTLPDGTVSVKYQVGDSIDRQNMEAIIRTRDGMHRAHLVPPGHGVEDPGGLAYTTPEVNLSIDKRIDNQIVSLHERAKAVGDQVHVTAQLRRGPNFEVRSKRVEVTFVRPDGSEVKVFATGYEVEPSGRVVERYFDPGPGWRDID